MTERRGRGRRDNGLDAPLWSPLRDVDPRVGEHLLDVLQVAEIAAYLEPSADVAPYTRNVSLPSPPAAPITSAHSPGLSWACSRNRVKAVGAWRETTVAVAKSSPSGTSAVRSARAVTYSA